MLQDDIEQLLQPAIEDMGYILWGCEYLSQGRHSLLRIYIDKEDGIGIEDCEKVSRRVNSILDVEDPISGNYSLEVSSPGIPRPLFKNWQFKNYIGHEVQIKLFKSVNGKRKYAGIISAVSDESLVLAVENDQQQEFLLTNIVKANLTLE